MKEKFFGRMGIWTRTLFGFSLAIFFSLAAGSLCFAQLQANLGSFANASAGPAFVQLAEKGDSLNTDTVNSGAFRSSVKSGDLIVVWIWYNSISQRVSSVTDTAGNIYVKAVGPSSGNGILGLWRQELWYAKDVKGGSLSVTANFTNKIFGEKSITAHEYSGVDQTAPLDAVTAAAVRGANISSPAATITSPNELIFGAGLFGWIGNAGSGFTQRSSIKENVSEDKDVSSVGSYNVTFRNNADVAIVQMATFKAAGSGGAGPGDTQAPSVPANLSVVVASSSQINLSWTPSTDNVGVAGYQVYRCVGSPCTPIQIGTTANNSYSDFGLTPLTQYTYAVSAYDAANNVSALSNFVSATTLPAASPVISNLQALEVTTSSAIISWVTDINGSTVVDYGTASNNLNQVYSDPTNGTLHTAILVNLAPGTTYYYTAQSSNSVGTTVSPQGSFTTAAPPVISNLSISNVATSTAVISWATNLNGSTVVVYGTDSNNLNQNYSDFTSETSHTATLTNLIPGTTYYYIAQSANDGGLGASSMSSFTTTPPPDVDPPTISIASPAANATLSGSNISLSATASDNVGVANVSFLVDSSPVGPVLTAAPYTVSWDSTTVANGSHTITAVAFDAAGNQAVSNPVTITVNNANTFTIPPQYQSLYNATQQEIINMSNLVPPSVTSVPVDYSWANYRSDADSGLGLISQLNTNLKGVDQELDEDQAMGLKAVSVSIGWPILDPNMYAALGLPTSDASQILQYYEDLAAQIRARGMKIIVEGNVLLTSNAIGGTPNLDATAYYKSLNFSQYEAARTAQDVEIAQDIHPDYFLLQTEPDTDANDSYRAELNNPASDTAMIGQFASAISAANIPGLHTTMKLGAGCGTWQQNWQSYISGDIALSGPSSLDVIDNHIYSVSGSGLLGQEATTSLQIIGMAHAAGKQAGISEFWPHKTSHTGDTQNDYRARDMFSFWEPLDAQFFSFMMRLANANNLDFLSVGQNYYYASYLNYYTQMPTSTSCPPVYPANGVDNSPCDALITNAEYNLAGQAISSGTFSITGAGYQNDITQYSLTPSTPPSVPTGLVATLASSSEVMLSWNPSTPGAGQLISGYEVYRCTGVPCTPTPLGSSIGTNYTDTGLLPLTTYSYAVSAFDTAANLSQESTLASATTPIGNEFQVGERIESTINTLNVRSSAGGGTVLGQENNGALGTVLAGPQLGNQGNNVWWQIQWDNGLTGWSAENYLASAGAVKGATISISQLIQGFTRDLTIGADGSDVQNLQMFLNLNGYPIAQTGDGSSGRETTSFGPKTAAALMKFQTANGLPATGYFGPLTRQYLQENW